MLTASLTDSVVTCQYGRRESFLFSNSQPLRSGPYCSRYTRRITYLWGRIYGPSPKLSYWPCFLAWKRKRETFSTRSACTSYGSLHQVLSILNQVSEAISPEFFLQNVFLIMVSSPASRLAATNYLARKLLRSSMPDQGLDVGLVVRGVAAVLEDENTLVRRGGLDLLLRVLPLSGSLMK